MDRSFRQKMNPVSILGAGRLGTVLGAALHRRGYRIRGFSCRSSRSAAESRAIIGAGEAFADNTAAAQGARTVFITVPDDALAPVVEELAFSSLTWNDVRVFHCSGLRSAQVLESLERRSAVTASLHPVQTFVAKRVSPDLFRGIFFGVEGGPPGRDDASRIARDLGGRVFPLEAAQKPLYHTACSMASNLLVPLIREAADLLPAAGISPEKGLQILMPLAQRTLQNVKELDGGDAAASLTGPLVRGDRETIEAHVSALAGHPRALALYRRLGRAALEMAFRQKRIPAGTYSGLMALLEDK
jgi:predicted short-subunit dehydrogenase-like oxidoreductase (DUF2520 family)